MHRRVDSRYARARLAYVCRQCAGIGIVWQGALVQRFKNAVPFVFPYMVEVGAPPQLIDKLVGGHQRMPGVHALQDFRKAQKTMAYVRRQTRDGAVNGVARCRVLVWVDGSKAGVSSLNAGLEALLQKNFGWSHRAADFISANSFGGCGLLEDLMHGTARDNFHNASATF